MSTIASKNYSSPKNINLKEGILRFHATNSSNPLGSVSNGLYVNSSNELVYVAQGVESILGTAGSLINYSLNDGYDDGRTITVDAGALTLNGVNQDTATLALNADAASGGPIVLFTNAGAGNDITGTSSTWSVSAAGAITGTSFVGPTLTSAANLDLEATGAGTVSIATTSTGAVTIGSTLVITGGADATALTITAGDILFSDGKIGLTDNDNETILALTSSGLSTGSAVVVTCNGLTDGDILRLVTTDAGLTTGYFVACVEDGSDVLTIGDDGATVIAGSATGTAALSITAGDFTMTDGVVSITNTADSAALTIVADAATDKNVIDVNADAVTTGVLLHLDTSAASFAGKYIQCYDGAADEFSVAADGATTITTSAAGTIGLTIASASTTGDALDITCTALTTGDALQITNSAETFAAGELLKIVNTENGNISATPKTGNLASITSSVTQTTASASLDYDTLLISRSNIANCDTFTLTAAGSVLKLMNTSTNTAGTCTDSTVGLEVLMVDGGTAAPTGDAVKITSVGVGAKALNIASASTSVSDVLITGSGVKASTKAVAEITGSGATAAGGAILRVSATGTPAAATSYLAVFTNAGGTMSSNPVCVYINAKDSTAAALQITGSGASAGGMLELNSTTGGALGAVLKFNHTPGAGAEAVGDVISRILFTGQDDADAEEVYGRIDCVLKDAAAANPDGALVFYADKAGTATQHLAIGWDSVADATFAGILVGTGAASGLISSQGAYDLVLETNGGTSSATITITDGANGDITLVPGTAGQVQLTAPSYGQITAGADGAAVLTVAMCGLYTIGNTIARTLTLPAVSGTAGLWYTIKKTSADAAAVTIDTPGAETIDGAATNAEVDAQYDSITIVSDGANWWVVNKKIAA